MNFFTVIPNPKLSPPQTKPSATKTLQTSEITTTPPTRKRGERGRTRSLLVTYSSRTITASSMGSLTKHCIFGRASSAKNPLAPSSLRYFNLRHCSRTGVVSYGLLPLRSNSGTWKLRTVCSVGGNGKGDDAEVKTAMAESSTITVGFESEERGSSIKRVEEMMERKKKERHAYIAAAVASFGYTSMAIASVYYRFARHMEGGEIPVSEILATFALSLGVAVGMEFWARWVHRALWHGSLWHMHKSHHRPREGPFELNDVFVIMNAGPALVLLTFGFHNSGPLPGFCFGVGLGITLYGIANMFLHDGLLHSRFPVGPIADIPYFRRVVAAHQIHHLHFKKFDGVPYGIFLGPKELEEVGGSEEMEKQISRWDKISV